ncbi:MAG: beta-lactamase family protein [Ruminococcaceae bacterium]|nr:beta-lactamase family protein [Oscillospiraceae bacterium]
MMTENKISKRIDEIRASVNVPYLEVICNKNGETVYKDIFGYDIPENTYLQMYSCSKPVTAFAAMLLVDEGKLSLDDDVAKYLPEINNAFIIDENNVRKNPKNKMKVRHLFTMTAGFTYDFNAAPIKELAAKDPKASLRDFIGAFVNSPISFEPGEKFQYSLCHDVLAAVVEVASGERFSEFVKKRIFDPLGMKDSFFDNKKVPFAKMYTLDAEDKIVPTGNENGLIFTENYESGGAGLVAAIEDFSKFSRMLAAKGLTPDGTRLISEEAFELMRSEQIGQMSIKNKFVCAQGKDYGYGLGVRVRMVDTPWGLPKGEFGWDGAAGSYIMADPANNISIVIGMHLMSWYRIFAGKHLEIVRALYENLL